MDENAVLNALDGFLIILSTDGDVIYVSENIHEYIGIQQVSNRTYYVAFQTELGTEHQLKVFKIKNHFPRN